MSNKKIRKEELSRFDGMNYPLINKVIAHINISSKIKYPLIGSIIAFIPYLIIIIFDINLFNILREELFIIPIFIISIILGALSGVFYRTARWLKSIIEILLAIYIFYIFIVITIVIIRMVGW